MASDGINESTVLADLVLNRKQQSIVYTVVGTVSLVLNASLIVILFSNWRFTRKWPLIVGMLVSNLGNALHSCVYGIYRLILMSNGSIDEQMSGWTCMLTLIPSFLLIGSTLPSVLQCLIGLERVAAIIAYRWYDRHWSVRKTWLATIGSCILCCVFWLLPAWYQVFREHFIVTRECSTFSVIDPELMVYMFHFINVVGIVGVCCTLMALMAGRRRLGKMICAKNSDSSKLQKQMRFTRIMVAVALLDTVFVIIPGLFMLLVIAGVPLPLWMVFYNATLHCAYCTFNICMYIGMNSQFRNVLLQTFHKAKVIIVSSRFSIP